MATPLQSSIDLLRQTLSSAAGVTIDYTTVSDGSVYSLTAVPGSTATEADFGDGIIRQDRLHDFIVNVRDLGFEPEPGDTIAYDSRLYEVMQANGLKHFSEVGPYKQMYRIHTRQVSAS